MAFLLSLYFAFAPTFTLANGTLIVSYSTGVRGERLERVRFWLINEKQHYQLFPKKHGCLDDPECVHKTVAVENLPAGNYRISFLIPNRDGFFENINERTFSISDLKVTKIDQEIKPRYASVEVTVVPIPDHNFPEITLSSQSGKILHKSLTGTLYAHHLLPGDYSLKFSYLEGYTSPETIYLRLHAKEHFGPLSVHYLKNR